jgi:amidase
MGGVDMTVLDADALDLSRRIAAGELSATELMEATLARIGAVNGTVNAIVSLRDPDVLLLEAAAADRRPQKPGWLHGIPVAIKDLANAKGLPTSQGSPIYAGSIADADDVMVARLRAAGAIVIGKTNTPEFGLGSHTFNPVHGPTKNPYDPTRSAGGSSGGAAAALASGMVTLADGSDMMGSLRNPAAWNNVYGMRPSWGLVPSQPGGEVYFDQLSTLGPMARSPRDLASLLDTMAGPTAGWPYERRFDPTLSTMDTAEPAPRIGWLADWGGELPMEAGVLSICASALAQAQDIGWQVEAAEPLFDLEAMWSAWIDLRSFSIAGDMQPEFGSPTARARLKPEMLWEIERGRGFSALHVFRQSQVRSDWLRAATLAFDTYDVLALPSAQMWPFDVDLVFPTEVAGRLMDTYHRWMQVVVPASLIGLPVVSVPVGFGSSGLPMGLQLIGKPGSDAKLLRLAENWHQMTKWPQKYPAFSR